MINLCQYWVGIILTETEASADTNDDDGELILNKSVIMFVVLFGWFHRPRQHHFIIHWVYCDYMSQSIFESLQSKYR